MSGVELGHEFAVSGAGGGEFVAAFFELAAQLEEGASRDRVTAPAYEFVARAGWPNTDTSSPLPWPVTSPASSVITAQSSSQTAAARSIGLLARSVRLLNREEIGA